MSGTPEPLPLPSPPQAGSCVVHIPITTFVPSPLCCNAAGGIMEGTGPWREWFVLTQSIQGGRGMMELGIAFYCNLHHGMMCPREKTQHLRQIRDLVFFYFFIFFSRVTGDVLFGGTKVPLIWCRSYKSSKCCCLSAPDEPHLHAFLPWKHYLPLSLYFPQSKILRNCGK